MIVTRCPTRIVLAGEGTDTLLTVAVKLYVYSVIHQDKVGGDMWQTACCSDLGEDVEFHTGLVGPVAATVAGWLSRHILVGTRVTRLETAEKCGGFSDDPSSYLACAQGGVNVIQGKKNEKLTLGKLGTAKLGDKLMLVFGDVGLKEPKTSTADAIVKAVRQSDWFMFDLAIGCNLSFVVPETLKFTHCKTKEPLILGTKWLSPNLSLFVCKSTARRDVKKKLEEIGLHCVPVEIDTAGVVCLLGPDARPRRTTAKRKARCKWNSCQRELPTGPVEQRALAFCSRECASDFEKLYGHL